MFGESETRTVKNLLGDKNSPIIQRRLDHWLISDMLQEDVVKSEFVTAIKTDRNRSLEIDSLGDQQRGPEIDQKLETNISPKCGRQNWVKSDRKKN